MIEVQLSRIVIRETSDQQRIYLREKGGTRQFPIVIGIHEAAAIDRKVRDRRPPRPMTHDLLASVVDALGGRLVRVVVSELRQNTFIARLDLERPDGGETIEVDARPSDAIALAAHLGSPIFVAEEVLEEVE
jgi:bifunctional DNase/RNase